MCVRVQQNVFHFANDFHTTFKSVTDLCLPQGCETIDNYLLSIDRERKRERARDGLDNKI